MTIINDYGEMVAGQRNDAHDALLPSSFSDDEGEGKTAASPVLILENKFQRATRKIKNAILFCVVRVTIKTCMVRSL